MHDLPRNCRCFTKFKICKVVSFNCIEEQLTHLQHITVNKIRVTYLINIGIRKQSS